MWLEVEVVALMPGFQEIPWKICIRGQCGGKNDTRHRWQVYAMLGKMIVDSEIDMLPKWARAQNGDQKMEVGDSEPRIPVRQLHVGYSDFPKSYLNHV